jgi:PPOX class probable F420-dependent enzyme
MELVATRQQGVLAAVTRSGYPHLTNVLYLWDPDSRTALVSTTESRVKRRILARDPHAALHIAGDHFWAYAVAECNAELSAVATTPGDPACRELLRVHTAFYGEQDHTTFYTQMINARRLVIRLRVRRLYGLTLDAPPSG